MEPIAISHKPEHPETDHSRVFILSHELSRKIDQVQPLAATVKRRLHFASLLDLLSDFAHHKSRHAILSPVPSDSQLSTPYARGISHCEIFDFVKNFDLWRYGLKANDRVGVLIPDGPELGLCMFAVMTYCTCAPMNPHNTLEELKSDLTRIRAKAVIIAHDTAQERIDGLAGAGLLVLRAVTLGGSIHFRLEPATDHTAHFAAANQFPHAEPSSNSDHALVLFTSGTSGTKKIVPYTLDTIVIGAVCVAASWCLSPDDVNLNMMPLYHVGGIVRNLLAPVLAGGSTMLCRGFDASLFVDLLETPAPSQPTWYYAAPTMHHAILQQFTLREPRPQHTLRMICNAAGGLLPSLAIQLRTTFNGAVVLPSYGMTECMPISAPPITYALDRPGTSGRAVGPEMAIMDDDWKMVAPKVNGNIVVRGPLVFTGYEGVTAEVNAQSFSPDGQGWFSTGDMGYLDQDGFIYITGRSKEVINRGGEIISPFEIEEALQSHPLIGQVLAFSIAHDTLQEAVGVVVVPRGASPRVDLAELQRFLNDVLHPAKWPLVIVYMNDLPKNQTGKVLRIGLAERLKLPEFTDDYPPTKRIFEATCPPKTAHVKSQIPCAPVEINYKPVIDLLTQKRSADISDAIVAIAERGNANLYVQSVAPPPLGPSDLDARLSASILEFLTGKVHFYLLPKKVVVLHIPIPRLADGSLDVLALPKTVTMGDTSSMNPWQKFVHNSFQKLLGISTPLQLTDDFFELGGNSLKAGQMFGLVGKQLKISIPVTSIYTHRTIEKLSQLLSEKASKDSAALVEAMASGTAPSAKRSPEEEGPLVTKASRQDSFLVMLVQLLPLLLIEPLKLLVRFLAFLSFLVAFVNMFHQKTVLARYAHMFIGVMLARVFGLVVFPIVGILLKWLIIGRVRPGRFPLWGHYYLRWWLANQCVLIFGRGFFNASSGLVVLYHRLLGAHIGSGTKISEYAQLSEWDLVTIGRNCAFDTSVIRPFRLELGEMVLSPITIGDNCAVGCRSVVCGGAKLPHNTVLGPQSSSHELKDASEQYREFISATFPGPHWLLVWLFGWPIVMLVRLIDFMPWIGLMYFSMNAAFTKPTIEPIYFMILVWFTEPVRVGWRVLARVGWNLLAPFVHVLLVIIIKRVFLGRISKPGPRDRSQCALFKAWLMQQLLPGQDLGGITHIIGTHYEPVSWIYRALGAKVGKRVYWPGSGLNMYDFDLLEIGDDVVFGSRSFVMCSDANTSAKVRIHDGAMVADRCVLLPGVEVGKCAVLGSGGLGKKNTLYPDNSVWVGSSGGNAVLWDSGSSQALPEETISPFGRAFYRGQADFVVLPLMAHIAVNVLAQMLASVLWLVPINASAFLLVHVIAPLVNVRVWNVGMIFAVMLPMVIVFTLSASFVAFASDVVFKWLLLGRRKEGSYDWDRSSYCQRWQLYLSLLRIRVAAFHGRGVMNYIQGSEWLVAFFRAMGCTIGENVCLYPHGADPMMTEPDLVTIHDHAAIDDASLICHRNTRGHFSLDPLVVGRGCIMRNGSRLLAGATMEDCSTLMEHTLLVSGAIAPYRSYWQAWPAAQLEQAPPYEYAIRRRRRRVSTFKGHHQHAAPPPSSRTSRGEARQPLLQREPSGKGSEETPLLAIV